MVIVKQAVRNSVGVGVGVGSVRICTHLYLLVAAVVLRMEQVPRMWWGSTFCILHIPWFLSTGNELAITLDPACFRRGVGNILLSVWVGVHCDWLFV